MGSSTHVVVVVENGNFSDSSSSSSSSSAAAVTSKLQSFCVFWVLMMLVFSEVELVLAAAGEYPSSWRSSRELQWDTSAPVAQQQLTPDFYASTCPQLASIVAEQVYQAAQADPRMPASLLRLHFHDCFVNGCDGSVLLSGYEQLAGPNLNSIRGLNVIADIKAAVEQACPATVSCADILAIVARDSVVLASKPLCNPGWTVLLGRRDSLTASEEAANAGIPGPFLDVEQLNANFANVGLSPQDVVVLSGAHTFGKVHCSVLDRSLYPSVDPLLNPAYANQLECSCPAANLGTAGGASAAAANGAVLVDLQPNNPYSFDTKYYRSLQAGNGTLYSDRTLFSTAGESRNLVQQFAPVSSTSEFFYQFGVSMVKMGNISPLTGSQGEIRTICSQPNQQ